MSKLNHSRLIGVDAKRFVEILRWISHVLSCKHKQKSKQNRSQKSLCCTISCLRWLPFDNWQFSLSFFFDLRKNRMRLELKRPLSICSLITSRPVVRKSVLSNVNWSKKKRKRHAYTRYNWFFESSPPRLVTGHQSAVKLDSNLTIDVSLSSFFGFVYAYVNICIGD